MRIFPEMCASTLCPLSSSTRNMALGSGSTTVPSTRIVSSLGLARTLHLLRAGRAGKARKNLLGPTDHAIWSAARIAIGHFAHWSAARRLQQSPKGSDLFQIWNASLPFAAVVG